MKKNWITTAIGVVMVLSLGGLTVALMTGKMTANEYGTALGAIALFLGGLGLMASKDAKSQ